MKFADADLARLLVALAVLLLAAHGVGSLFLPLRPAGRNRRDHRRGPPRAVCARGDLTHGPALDLPRLTARRPPRSGRSISSAAAAHVRRGR